MFGSRSRIVNAFHGTRCQGRLVDPHRALPYHQSDASSPSSQSRSRRTSDERAAPASVWDHSPPSGLRCGDVGPRQFAVSVRRHPSPVLRAPTGCCKAESYRCIYVSCLCIDANSQARQHPEHQSDFDGRSTTSMRRSLARRKMPARRVPRGP